MTKFYYFLSSEQFQPEVLVGHAVLAERVGFDGVVISEHFHPWVDDKSASGNAFVVLGAIAARTKNIRLATGVVAPLFRYHPAVLAQISATIDRLSNGRFELGLGTGRLHDEGALGFDFPPYIERSERIKEIIEIIQKMFLGSQVTYKGKYYQTQKAKLYSPPNGTIPIYMAAGGPKSANIAIKKTDGLIVSVSDVNATVQNIIKPAKIASGKKAFKLIAAKWSIYAKNESEAWEALKPQRGLRAPQRDTEIDPAVLRKQADLLQKNEILAKYSVVKSAEDYINVYKPLFVELKADTVVIQTTSINQEKTIKMIGKEVLPKLRKL